MQVFNAEGDTSNTITKLLSLCLQRDYTTEQNRLYNSFVNVLHKYLQE